MTYLDTSLVIASLIRERRSEAVLAWISSFDGPQFAVSPWVNTEVASALALNVRTQAISQSTQNQAWASWQIFLRDSMYNIDITEPAFDMAAEYCADPVLALKAGDALHLAVAQSAGLAVATLDRGMLSAGLALGISIFNPVEVAL